MPTGQQKLLHGLGFILIDLAAKGVKTNLHSKYHQINRADFVKNLQSAYCKAGAFLL